MLVDEVIEIMKEFYPYLLEKAEYIKTLVTIEERKFLDKLADGEKILNDIYNKYHEISGEHAFLLYDTYGYPFEITLEFAEERGLTIEPLFLLYKISFYDKMSVQSKICTIQFAQFGDGALFVQC